MIRSWGSKFVAIIFSIIIHIENQYYEAFMPVLAAGTTTKYTYVC